MSAREMTADSSKWTKVMSECLAAVEREQAGSACPVVDHELVPSLNGGPDDLGVWLICRSRQEQRLFSDTECSRFVSALRKKMLAAGLPESAVASLTARVTSREDVDAQGGRLGFFR